MELLKQASWSQSQPSLYHFRTVDNSYEVDFVLEAPDGKIVGIECKASSEVNASSFKGIKFLKENAGDRFHRGIVLYTGSNTLAFDNDLTALPVSALWETASEAAPILSVIQ